MPSQETIKKIGINPFAVCASRGLKRGTDKYERCVESVTRSALGKAKIGMTRKKKKG